MTDISNTNTNTTFNLSATNNDILVRPATGNELEGIHTNGQRGKVYWFKEIKDRAGKVTRPKLPSMFAMVPTIAVDVSIPALADMVRDHLASMQDAIIKEAIEARAEANNNNLTAFHIPASSVTAQAIADYSKQRATSAKLDGDQIKAWCNTNLHDALYVTLASNALKITDIATISTENDIRLRSTIAAYIAGLCKCAAPVPSINAATAKDLLLAVSLTETDAVSTFLSTKLQRVIDAATQQSTMLSLL